MQREGLSPDQAARLSGRSDSALESLRLLVRGGEVAALVPLDTAAEAAIGSARRIRAALHLENEQALIVDIRADAHRASFEDASAHLHEADGPSQILSTVRAREVMTQHVLTTSADDLVEDAVKRLAYHEISAMPVEDWDGSIIGIVSQIDVIDKLGVVVRDVMSTEVVSVESDTSIDQVASIMVTRQLKRVPVFNAGKLVGIISRADIVRVIAERVPVAS